MPERKRRALRATASKLRLSDQVADLDRIGGLIIGLADKVFDPRFEITDHEPGDVQGTAGEVERDQEEGGETVSRPVQVYAVECVNCGAQIETPTLEVRCACGLFIRLEWQWKGEVSKGK